MKRKFLSRGLKRYVRGEKARLRKEAVDVNEQKKKIDELYKSCRASLVKP